MPAIYHGDLAFIHDLGFQQLAAHAAPVMLEALAGAGFAGGRVVDLGCGGGVAARRFRDAGYQVLGIDGSWEMIELARRRVPDGDFRTESFLDADIPPCVAVAGIGEVFNYLADSRNDRPAWAGLLARVHAALRPGGVLLFDMAGPNRPGAREPYRTFASDEAWTVLMEAGPDPETGCLVRRITTFRRVGGYFRRGMETHLLRLADPGEVVETLRSTGFSVDVLDAYGPFRFPEGLHGYLARKAG